jgi:5'-phosphate synthase pdxT subunit
VTKIGVLALQGDFAEHVVSLERLGVEAAEIRLPAELDDLDGLIIPGGESTTIGKLMVAFDLLDPIIGLARHGLPIWGTCAGMIMLASRLDGHTQPLIGAMDMTVKRNAFGRQVDSFETDLDVKGLDAPFPAVFIRAPAILDVGRGVDVLATLDDGTIVAAQQKNLLATAFHPELTRDDRIHGLFVETVKAAEPAR